MAITTRSSISVKRRFCSRGKSENDETLFITFPFLFSYSGSLAFIIYYIIIEKSFFARCGTPERTQKAKKNVKKSHPGDRLTEFFPEKKVFGFV
ncbi:MAG: hypothetical protein J5806_03355 [Lentisphaeria bacterium]|nr:hypothetical protein [Lentisphaeria bacterium]